MIDTSQFLTDFNALRIIFFVMLFLIIIAYSLKKDYDFTTIYKIIFVVISANLFLTILNPAYSLLNLLSFDTIPHQSIFESLDNPQQVSSSSDYWSIRGQIGDVLSGHFTALAFIGLLASLQLQRKSMLQMQESINQNVESITLQNKAIIQQTKALKRQKKEFKQQTQEIENQTTQLSNQHKEMESARIYQKFEFYYKELEAVKKTITLYDSNFKEYNNFNDLIYLQNVSHIYIDKCNLDSICKFYQFLYEIISIKNQKLKYNLNKFYNLNIEQLDKNILERSYFYAEIHAKLFYTSENKRHKTCIEDLMRSVLSHLSTIDDDKVITFDNQLGLASIEINKIRFN